MKEKQIGLFLKMESLSHRVVMRKRARVKALETHTKLHSACHTAPDACEKGTANQQDRYVSRAGNR